jgi:hypothetical protein
MCSCMGLCVYVRVCRTEEKANAAAKTAGAAGAFACDLSSLDSVRAFAKAWGSKVLNTFKYVL